MLPSNYIRFKQTYWQYFMGVRLYIVSPMQTNSKATCE